MTKFNVGDKVRVIKPHFYFEIGDVFTINKIDYKGSLYTDGFKYRSAKEPAQNEVCVHSHKVELVQEKQTKNQRITALENEVAELKLIVHELRGHRDIDLSSLTEPSTTNTVEDIIEFEGEQYRKVDRLAQVGDVVICHSETTSFIEKGKPYKVSFVDGHLLLNQGTPDVISLYFNERTPETVDVYELIEHKPLTSNQQRAAIIEKAKKFVEQYTTPNSISSEWRAKGAISWNGYGVYPKFFVNENKRMVTLIFKGAGNPRKIYKRTFAKCNPSDVFNEHIGKAIALGRALGLNVSEFEQAVQPNEKVVGMKVKLIKQLNHSSNFVGAIRTLAEPGFYVNGGELVAVDSLFAENSEIINDTNAKY